MSLVRYEILNWLWKIFTEQEMNSGKSCMIGFDVAMPFRKP